MKQYTRKQKLKALRMHRNQWGYRRIAKEFGCAESTVKKWVERSDQPKHPKPDHDSVKRKAALDTYRNNKEASISGTAKEHGVHAKTLARWLDAEGIKPRVRPTQFSKKGIAKDLKTGMSGADIARKHECSESYVSAIRNGRI